MGGRARRSSSVRRSAEADEPGCGGEQADALAERVGNERMGRPAEEDGDRDPGQEDGCRRWGSPYKTPLVSTTSDGTVQHRRELTASRPCGPPLPDDLSTFHKRG